MKRTVITIQLLIASLFAQAEEYTLIGQRNLRLYTAPEPTQAYNAGVDAQRIADSLCNVPWTTARSTDATTTSHVNEELDRNVENRDRFDAAIFCANHTNGTHIAYANAAVYRYRLPDGPLPNLTRLTARISSDPYNALGARVVIYTNSSGEIPMDCATCRGENPGGIKLSGLAPRITKQVQESGKSNSYWYPNTTNAVFTSTVPLQNYLFVFVLMENYATSRGNWLEGCSYMENRIRITTDAPMPGWTDGDVIDLSNTGSYSAAPDEWMPYFETTNTIVIASKGGQSASFAAPEFAYRLIHYGSTNLSHVTHAVSKFDDNTWSRGSAVSNLTGWTVTEVLESRRVAVSGHDVYVERGFETDPPSRGKVKSDSDGDGIPDGWELYVGSNPLDPSDATSDWDGDGLTLAQEYDHGHFPTDPNNANTFKDGVSDMHAFIYHLKGSDAGADFDGDGLSNYAEYLISEVFQFTNSAGQVIRLDPDRRMTDGMTIDYFRKAGDMYFGEVFSDHDQVDDLFEDTFSFKNGREYANRSVYDPDRDDDGDGWSNYAEFRANTDPTNPYSFPVPEIAVYVFRRGKLQHNGSIVFKCWSETKDQSMFGAPDCTWSCEQPDTSCADEMTYLTLSRANESGSSGRMAEGKNVFVCFVDENGDGNYSAGELYGFVRGVDVGWQGAKFEVELTESSPVFARVNIYDKSDDRVLYWGADSGDLDYKLVNTNDKQVIEDCLSGGYYDHVRIVPYVVAGTKTNYALYDRNYVPCISLLQNRVVAEFDVNSIAKPYITEADFIRDGKFDIYWDIFDTREFAYNDMVIDAVGDVTAVKYRIVLGKEGPVGPESNLDTTTVVRAFSTLIERRYEPVASRTLPTGLKLKEDILFASRPTFMWRLDESTAVDGYAASAALYGCSYTAFRILVVEDDNNGVAQGVVYDSGVQRAPVRNREGYFVWTAPLSAGDQTPLGKIFSRAGNYSWKVAMYNAKFHPSSISDRLSNYGWSVWNTFSTAVGQQQVIDDHNYSAIGVAVKYAGPEEVLNNCADTTTTTGMVRIQAFTTADFAGEPVAQAFITNKTSLVDTTDVAVNGVLYGLPVRGTYYIRAYIDSNGNFRKDDWESWGCDRTPITLDPSDTALKVASVYIEDADTDQDCVPDAWEYEVYGDFHANN